MKLSLPPAAFLLLFQPLLASAAEQKAFLGVRLIDVPPELATHLGLEGGALVAEVVPGSPAEKAGIRPHDVITAAGGKALAGPEALRQEIGKLLPKDKLVLQVRRGEMSLDLEVELGAGVPPPKQPGFLGLRLSPVPPALAAHLALEKGSGALVDEVLEGSGAEKAGIARHDVLLSIDGAQVRSERPARRFVPDLPPVRRLAPDVFLPVFGDPTNAHELLRQRQAGEEVQLELIHRGERKQATVTLSPPPSGAPFFGIPEATRKGLKKLRPDDWGEFQFRLHPPATRGKIILKSADGDERVIELPGWLDEDLLRDSKWLLEESLDKLGNLPENVQKRVERLLERKFEDFKLDARSLRAPLENVFEFHRRRSASVSRLVEGGYDVTVREEDGKRIFSIEKDGKSLAEDRPFEELESLPEEARAKVLEAASGLPATPTGGAERTGARPAEPAEEEIDLDSEGGIRL
jgi:hypothetical protein